MVPDARDEFPDDTEPEFLIFKEKRLLILPDIAKTFKFKILYRIL